jgi:photosynthetic reaction center cytochrome c subunit
MRRDDVDFGEDSAHKTFVPARARRDNFRAPQRREIDMEVRSKRGILLAVGMAVMCLVGAWPTWGQAGASAGQAATADKPVMSEQFFKNVQVLKGIPVDQFLGTMGFIAASLSVNCTECHAPAGRGMIMDYSVDTPKKQKARQMMLMVKALNQANFGGKHRVTCWTCHRSDTEPPETPSLAVQNGTAPDRDPNDVELLDEAIPGTPTAEQILDKYIQALGGAERLSGLTSLSAKGAYSGFDTDLGKVPLELYTKFPGQRTTIVHRSEKAENITTYDGKNGWIVMTNTVLPVKSLTGGELDAAQLDAEMFFPARIKEYLHDWRIGFPPTTVDDHLTQVVQATAPGGTRVKLFFDTKSGLLVRMTRFAETTLGLNPSEVDYSDYRDLAGVKVPFHWTLTWTDGRSDFDLTEAQPNVAIDAAKFGEMVLPKPAKP